LYKIIDKFDPQKFDQICDEIVAKPKVRTDLISTFRKQLTHTHCGFVLNATGFQRTWCHCYCWSRFLLYTVKT